MIDSVFESKVYQYFAPSESIQASSEDWLTLSPDEVNDIISEKQQELDAYLQRKKKKENQEDKGEDNQEKKKENNDDLSGEENEENPIDKLASCVKEFVKNSSNFEGIKSKGPTKSQKKEQEDEDESSSEDESDEFYRYVKYY